MIALNEPLTARASDDATASPDVSILLRDVPWEAYVSLRSADSNRHLRMTYETGAMERPI